MKEVWKEMIEGVDKGILLITLLSIVLIGFLAYGLSVVFSSVKYQQESIIKAPNLKRIQTNFTL